MDGLADVVRTVSHGASTPMGLEMLSMAISGEGPAGHDSLASAVRDGLHEIAQAQSDGLESIANAIRNSGRH
jgi:hypothetical protein